jgi:Tfp pilus assembly protein PilV
MRWLIQTIGKTARVSTGERGISLIEGLAGMIMLSLGLLTLLPLATISISSNELARDTADAASVLQNQIERLRSEPVIVDGSETDPETGMYSHWWVETDPNGLQKVHVEVIWYTDLGVARYQRATTYIFRTEDEAAL